MGAIKSFKDLEVYKIAHGLAMEIFHLTKTFPKDEKYSLTSQIRQSSRSVSSNIAEGWGKRIYEQVFKRHLMDANGSLEETREWLQYSYDCEYIEEQSYNDLNKRYDQLGAKLFRLHENWTTFKSKK